MTIFTQTTEARETRIECGSDGNPGCGSTIIIRTVGDRAYVTTEFKYQPGPAIANWLDQDCEDMVRDGDGTLHLQCPALNAASEERCEAHHEVKPEALTDARLVEVPTTWLFYIEEA